MPITKTGTHLCEKCGKGFEWNLFEMYRDKMDAGSYRAEIIPDNITKVFRHEVIDGKEVYSVNCPHCDYENRFSE